MKNQEPEEKSELYRHNKKNELILNKRQISWVTSVVILLSFFVFISGYFLGKKRALEHYQQSIDHDVFADHIYTNFCSLYNNGNSHNKVEKVGAQDNDYYQEDEEKRADDHDASIHLGQEKVTNNIETVKTTIKPEHSDQIFLSDNVEKKENQAMKRAEQLDRQYYAQLIGFGTARAADKFVGRLLQRNISVVVHKRHSKTAQGRITSWYQVVTEKLSSKDELNNLVNKIKKQEKLNDVRIISC